MKLQCTYPHMANESILANGNTYTCDKDGVVDVASKKDAAKILLDTRGWRKYVAREPVGPSQVLVKSTGRPVEEPKPEPKPEPVAVVAPEPVVAPVEEIEEVLDKVEALLPKVAVPPAVPEEGEDWPDPTEDMDIEYLRLMAKDYQLKFHHNTGKAKLIDKLTEAMFDEE